MNYSDNKEYWFRDLITDHYQNPRNKGLVDSQNYKIVHLKNPSCGDDLMIQVLFNDEQIITDIRFEGSGCAICCASASIMTENTKNRTTSEALILIEAFSQMMIGSDNLNEELLQEAICLQGVAKLPPRIKCASLGYKALHRAITNEAVNDSDLEEVNIGRER
jgi:SUF system FeS assembly protein, NifU family